MRLGGISASEGFYFTDNRLVGAVHNSTDLPKTLGDPLKILYSRSPWIFNRCLRSGLGMNLSRSELKETFLFEKLENLTSAQQIVFLERAIQTMKSTHFREKSIYIGCLLMAFKKTFGESISVSANFNNKDSMEIRNLLDRVINFRETEQQELNEGRVNGGFNDQESLFSEVVSQNTISDSQHIYEEVENTGPERLI